MKKERVRLSLDVSQELYDQLDLLADELDTTISGAIRIALQDYIKVKNMSKDSKEHN